MKDQKERGFVHYLPAIPEVKVPQINLTRSTNSNLQGGIKLLFMIEKVSDAIEN